MPVIAAELKEVFLIIQNVDFVNGIMRVAKDILLKHLLNAHCAHLFTRGGRGVFEQ